MYFTRFITFPSPISSVTPIENILRIWSEPFGAFFFLHIQIYIHVYSCFGLFVFIDLKLNSGIALYTLLYNLFFSLNRILCLFNSCPIVYRIDIPEFIQSIPTDGHSGVSIFLFFLFVFIDIILHLASMLIYLYILMILF